MHPSRSHGEAKSCGLRNTIASEFDILTSAALGFVGVATEGAGGRGTGSPYLAGIRRGICAEKWRRGRGSTIDERTTLM